MGKHKVIFEACNTEIQENIFESDKFASISDLVYVAASLAAKDGAKVALSVLSFDKDGEENEVYREEKKADSNGEIKIEYGFDPISLAVYKNAVNFALRVEMTGGLCKINSLSVSEVLPEESDSDKDSLKNTVTDANGEAKVLVKQLDGTEILVPRVPKHALFIGNSLVFGMGGRYGMCSSAPDKDYYHYVTSHIRKYNPMCEFDKLFGSYFEHSESVEMFDSWYYEDCKISASVPLPAVSKFKEDLDLIIIQLSDNINTEKKEETFRLTGDMLIERIKAACPRARIIWVHGWYKKAMADAHIEKLCEKWGIERVYINSCRSKEAEAHNQKYYYDVNEGKQKEVKETWITHPGDLGMKKIADKIIGKLELV